MVTLSLSHESLVYEVEKEIGILGKNEILVYFSHARGEQPLHKNVFILQWWNSRWEDYVDVTDVDKVIDGNRLMNIPQKIAQCSLL